MAQDFRDLAYSAEDHPTFCPSGAHPGDALLRSYGWEVASRPRKGPALWRRAGVVLEADDALLTCLGKEEG